MDIIQKSGSIISKKTNVVEIEDASKKLILLRLLNNEFNPAEVWTHPAFWDGADPGCSQFLTLIFRFDQFRDLKAKLTAYQLFLLRNEISLIARLQFSMDFACEVLENSLDHTPVILCSDTFTSERLSLVLKKCTTIINSIEERCNIKITAGIGSRTDGLTELAKSYQNALTASEYRLIRGLQAIILYQDIKEINCQQTQYPFDLEQHLLSAVRQANKEQTLMCLNQFFDVFTGTCVANIQSSLIQLCAALYKLFNSLNFTGITEKVNFSNFVNELLYLDTLELIKTYLANILIEHIHVKDQNQQVKSEEQLHTAIDYIKANYSNPDLTIELLAQHVSYSPSHLRKLFRDAFNCSPTDYLFRFRLETAKRLLVETKLTAKAIAEMTGYLNTKYFYIVFKKSTGLTTYEYREANQK